MRVRQILKMIINGKNNGGNSRKVGMEARLKAINPMLVEINKHPSIPRMILIGTAIKARTKTSANRRSNKNLDEIPRIFKRPILLCLLSLINPMENRTRRIDTSNAGLHRIKKDRKKELYQSTC